MLFAASMAWLSEVNRCAHSTGPNTSDCHTSASEGTGPNTAGRTKKPPSGRACLALQVISGSPASRARRMKPLTPACWTALASGPSRVEGSSGSPMGNDASASASLGTSTSQTLSCTSKRDVAEQICPLFPATPYDSHSTTRVNAASPRTASSNTTAELLPPSSKDTALAVAAAVAATAAPALVEPVKVTFATPPLAARAAPTVSPRPGTTFRTPRGKPASAATLARSSADSGVYSDGLSTTGQPAASAGATFHTAIRSG